MKAIVNESCIGCGLCAATVPDVFRLKDDGMAEAYTEFDGGMKDAVQDAIDSCPVSAIDWDE